MRKLFLITLMLYASFLSAQTEEDLDREFLGDGDIPAADVKKSNWEVGGFLQTVYQQAIPFTGDASDYSVVKAEGRGRIETLWSYRSYSMKAVVDAFYYPRQHFEKTEPHNRIEIPELYFQGGEKFQYRLGVQKFAWGSCELFRLTRYFSRYDLSEFLAKDPDDINKGVGSVSLKYLFGEFSLEGVWTPLHYPVVIPRGFWELKDQKPYESQFVYSDSIDYDAAKSSVGLRFGGTVKGVDLFLSYFNGFSANALLDSSIAGTGILAADDLTERYAKVTRENSLKYSRVNSIGFELSTVIKKLTLKFETAMTPDYVTSLKVTDSKLDELILNLPDGDSDVQITEKKRVPYLAYSIGADYNLWGRYGMILAEWTQGIFFENITRYSYPATSYLFLLMLQDSFFDKRLTLRGGTIFRPISVTPGGLASGEAAWKFTGNFEMSFRGAFFFGNDDPLFEYFEDKHILEVKVKYTF